MDDLVLVLNRLRRMVYFALGEGVLGESDDGLIDSWPLVLVTGRLLMVVRSLILCCCS